MKSRIFLASILILFYFLLAPPALAATWHILNDGTGDAPTIQAGLDLCDEGDVVLVAAGTYFENLVWPSVDGIQLVSESGSEVTGIDGGGIDRVILVDTGVGESTEIRGFTIRNGITNQQGGGIFCNNGSYPTIAENSILDNTALQGGGGIACRESSPIIVSNFISGNVAEDDGGGIECHYYSSPLIDNNNITNNTVTSSAQCVGGGGISCLQHCSPRITNNNIAFNQAVETGGSGGGISVYQNSSPTIESNTISSNQSLMHGGGLFIANSCSPTMSLNLVDANVSNIGGGLCIAVNSAGVYYRNTIAENSVSYSGAGICVSESAPTIECNTIMDNLSITNGGGITATQDHSNISFNRIRNNGAQFGGGVYCTNTSFATVEHNTIANNNGHGVYSTSGSNPVVCYNNIVGNSEFGVMNMDERNICATGNWWGDPSGPSGEGPGTGDAAGIFVDFEPWAEVEFAVPSPVIPQVPGVQMSVYPNPFNPQTMITFVLDRQQQVEITVYDLNGRQVNVLANRTFDTSSQSIAWNGRDGSGRGVASGAYFVRLSGDSFNLVRKVVLIR